MAYIIKQNGLHFSEVPQQLQSTEVVMYVPLPGSWQLAVEAELTFQGPRRKVWVSSRIKKHIATIIPLTLYRIYFTVSLLFDFRVKESHQEERLKEQFQKRKKANNQLCFFECVGTQTLTSQLDFILNIAEASKKMVLLSKCSI